MYSLLLRNTGIVSTGLRSDVATLLPTVQDGGVDFVSYLDQITSANDHAVMECPGSGQLQINSSYSCNRDHTGGCDRPVAELDRSGRCR